MLGTACGKCSRCMSHPAYAAGLADGRRLGLEEAAKWCDAEADGIRKRMSVFERMDCDDAVRDMSGDLVRARHRAIAIRALIEKKP